MLARRLRAAAGNAGGGEPVFVSASAVTTTQNPTVSIPSGYQSGDLLVVMLATDSGQTITNGGSGWTRIATGTSSVSLYVGYKVAGASESSISFTNTGTSTAAVMLCYTATNSSPLDVGGTVNASNAASIATVSLTTTTANDVVISFWGGNRGSDGTTWTTIPSGTTTRVNHPGTSGGRAILIVDEIQAVAGATTSRTASQSAGANRITSYAASFKPA